PLPTRGRGIRKCHVTGGRPVRTSTCSPPLVGRAIAYDPRRAHRPPLRPAPRATSSPVDGGEELRCRNLCAFPAPTLIQPGFLSPVDRGRGGPRKRDGVGVDCAISDCPLVRRGSGWGSGEAAEGRLSYCPG